SDDPWRKGLMAITMEERLTAAIASMVTFYAEERWQRWAKLWLSERDRSAGSAHAMQEDLRDLAGDPDSARTLFTRASIGVAQTLASRIAGISGLVDVTARSPTLPTLVSQNRLC